MKNCFWILLLTLGISTGFAQTERLFGQTSKGTETHLSRGSVIGDPGFEGGTPNTAWTEASSNFGSPICDAASCGTGTGTGPNSGSFWAWFGGITGVVEEASVSQDVDIPSVTVGTTLFLSFAFEAAVCDGTGFLEILIDGNQEFLIDETDPLCGVLGYSNFDVDITAYQGQTVNLSFNSITQGDAGLNFFIDDVGLSALGPPLATIGGTLTGLLDGNEITIQNNLMDDLTLTSNGEYFFSSVIGEMYDVTVLAQPTNPSQTCLVTNASGTNSGTIGNINIDCDNSDLIFSNGFEAILP